MRQFYIYDLTNKKMVVSMIDLLINELEGTEIKIKEIIVKKEDPMNIYFILSFKDDIEMEITCLYRQNVAKLD